MFKADIMWHKFKYWLEANEHHFIIGAVWGLYIGFVLSSLAVMMMEEI